MSTSETLKIDRDAIIAGHVNRDGVGKLIVADNQAKGADAFPRLAGQLDDYIIRKLTNWTKERGQDPPKPVSSAIMESIAHNLTETR
jgi:hypothetical protein